MKRKNAKKPKVYLAGRITNAPWRGRIINDGKSDLIRYDYLTVGYEEPSLMYADYYDGEHHFDDFIVTGPHSVGCDHGCAHSEYYDDYEYSEEKGEAREGCEDIVEDPGYYSSRGHASFYIDCMGEVAVTREDIRKACLHQIDKSDLVFAYIDRWDAYGTLAEIGYAKAKRKRIVIVFKNQEICDLHWFVREMADTYMIAGEDKLKVLFEDELQGLQTAL